MIRIPEIGAVYGAFDSALFLDGDVPSAHVLREMSRSANRLLCRGERLINLVFDIFGGAHEISPVGALSGWGLPRWSRIVPGPSTVPTMPGFTKAKLFVRAHIAFEQSIQIQIATRAAPFDPGVSNTAVNQVELFGTGFYEWYTLADIPIDTSGGAEVLDIFAIGTQFKVTTQPGGTSSGTIEEIADSGERLIDTGASYDTTVFDNWAYYGTALSVEDAAGNQTIAPRWVTAVPNSTALGVWPRIRPEENIRVTGGTYRIRDLPRWRLANIALYAQDRTG